MLYWGKHYKVGQIVWFYISEKSKTSERWRWAAELWCDTVTFDLLSIMSFFQSPSFPYNRTGSRRGTPGTRWNGLLNNPLKYFSLGCSVQPGPNSRTKNQGGAHKGNPGAQRPKTGAGSWGRVSSGPPPDMSADLTAVWINSAQGMFWFEKGGQMREKEGMEEEKEREVPLFKWSMLLPGCC